jgi:hypothetical protein
MQSRKLWVAILSIVIFIAMLIFFKPIISNEVLLKFMDNVMILGSVYIGGSFARNIVAMIKGVKKDG